MRTIRRQLTDIHLPYPLDREAPLSKILFMDIETTGFTARNSILYLIGCAFFENGQWYTIQWLATSGEEEKEVIQAFFSFASDYTHLIHFNGNNFDLPFILQKCTRYGLPFAVDKLERLGHKVRLAFVPEHDVQYGIPALVVLIRRRELNPHLSAAHDPADEVLGIRFALVLKRTLFHLDVVVHVYFPPFAFGSFVPFSREYFLACALVRPASIACL